MLEYKNNLIIKYIFQHQPTLTKSLDHVIFKMSDKKGTHKGEQTKGKQRNDSEVSEDLGDDDKKMVGSMFAE